MIRWLIWSIYVILWTVALELPVKDPGVPGGEFILTNRILFAKTLHVAAYAALTVLSAWVPTPGRYRFLMMFFLMAHACGTELLQEVLEPWCHRGGEVMDVGLDMLGIALGTCVSWRWWTRDSPP